MTEPVTFSGVAESLRTATNLLTGVSDTPRLDAELLMAHALGVERQAVLLDPGRFAIPELYTHLIARRMAHEPIAYIVGYRDFWTLRVSVGPGVLTRLGRHAGAIKQLRRMGSGVQDALIRKWAFDSPVTTDLVSFVAEQFFSTPFEVIAAFLPSLEAHDQTHGLTAYSGIETLVVNGTGDLITPPEHSEELVRRLPGAEHVLIEDGGHVIMLEHPQIVSQQILMLIARAQRAEEEGVAVSRKPRVTRTITDLGARARGSRSRSRSTTAS